MPRRLRPWKDSMSPTRPMIVRVTPRLTKACPPTPSTRSVTCAICSSVASGAITTTMRQTLVALSDPWTTVPATETARMRIRLSAVHRGFGVGTGHAAVDRAENREAEEEEQAEQHDGDGADD